MACEDANTKLVEVVTVVDVDAEKRVDDSLVQIWKMKFGYIAKCLFRQTGTQSSGPLCLWQCFIS